MIALLSKVQDSATRSLTARLVSKTIVESAGTDSLWIVGSGRGRGEGGSDCYCVLKLAIGDFLR